MKIKEIGKKIEVIKKRILLVGTMRPGSLSKQYSVCGKDNCQCADPENPKKHGPYHKLSYVHNGKNTTRFIRQRFYKQIKQETDQYRKFRSLIDEWITLAIHLSQEKLNKEKKKKEVDMDG